MEKKLKQNIINNVQIKKFCAYGFLKNLKFFEPYLIIFLLASHINLFYIGILYTIREIIINIFEIPSGVLGDIMGCKKELMLSFVFYIISFIFFFLTNTFLMATIAMIFFGLGDAMRSGTHKTMIYRYLEIKGWQQYKTFVYGRTKSWSLTGSAISSVVAILFILNIPRNNYIFLISIIPYLIDFALIYSYPNELDKVNHTTNKISQITIEYNNFVVLVKDVIKQLYHKKNLQKLLINNGIFEATVKSTKDLVQPLLKLSIISSGFIMIENLNTDENLKIVLGLTYALFYLLSSAASRQAYRIKKYFNLSKTLTFSLLLLGIILVLISLFTSKPIIIVFLFLMVYIVRNIRKPIYLDELDNTMEKKERVTMLSISSQLISVFTIIFAPIIGYIANKYGINYTMILMGTLLIVTYLVKYYTSSTKKTQSI